MRLNLGRENSRSALREASLNITFFSFRPSKLQVLFCGLSVILSAVIWLYLPIMNTPYLPWDDNYNIFMNPFYLEGIWHYLWTTPYFGMYIPMTYSAWGGLWTLGGGASWPFRFFNLGLHLVNIVLLFALLKKWQSHFAQQKMFALWLALALFALHPLQIDTVAWITGGRDLLCAFWTLSCLWIFFSVRGWKGAFFSTLFFLFALLSKPSAVTLPALVLLLLLALNLLNRKKAILLGAWTVASVVFSFLTFKFQMEHFHSTLTFFERLSVVSDTYGFHLLKTIWPSHLSTDYGRTPAFVISSASNWIWNSFVFLLSLFGLGTLYFKSRRFFYIALLWFALLFPVSGIVDFSFQVHSTAADHYNYLPLAVIALLLMQAVSAIDGFLIRESRKISVGFAATLLLVPLILISDDRLRDWLSPEAFFEAILESNPRSSLAAIGLSSIECGHPLTSTRGLEHIQSVLAVKPNSSTALTNQAACFLRLNKASDVFRIGTTLSSGERYDNYMHNRFEAALIVNAIGLALIQTGRTEKALVYICEALSILPSDLYIQSSLSNLRFTLRGQNKKVDCDSNTNPYDFFKRMAEDLTPFTL